MQTDRNVGQTSPDRPSSPTPIPISRNARIILIVAGVVILALVLSLTPSVPIIVLGGSALAIALSFPVGFLVPALIAQIADLINELPRFATEAERSTRGVLRELDERGQLPADPDELLGNVTRQLLPRIEGLAESILSGALGAVSGVFGLGVRLFGMIFVAVYLLLDTAKVRQSLIRLAPTRYERDAAVLWEALNQSLSRYLSGLALSLAIQGALSALALWALDVPYALLLGAWVSLTAIIPNLGSFLGAIPAVVLALFESPTTALLTVLLYVGIQQMESNLLTPRIQAQAVRVHPVVVLLAVIGAAEVAGLAGAIFAVPALAVLRVLWDFFGVRLVVRQ